MAPVYRTKIRVMLALDFYSIMHIIYIVLKSNQTEDAVDSADLNAIFTSVGPGQKLALKFAHGSFAQVRFFLAQTGPDSANMAMPGHVYEHLRVVPGLREWTGKLYNRLVVATVGPEFDRQWFIDRVGPGLESITPVP